MVTLLKEKTKQVQLVIIPPYTLVPLHQHLNVVNDITPLFGIATIKKGHQTLTIDGLNYNKTHTIENNEKHGIRTFSQPFAFITEQNWLNGQKVISIEKNWKGSTKL